MLENIEDFSWKEKNRLIIIVIGRGVLGGGGGERICLVSQHCSLNCGFNSRLVWVEFVVSSCLAQSFNLWDLWFSFLLKINISKFIVPQIFSLVLVWSEHIT